MPKKSILQQGFEAVATALREFGYSGVTPEMVEQAHGAWKSGDQPSGVIAMFAVKDFDEHPEIFGTKGEQA